MLNCKLYFEWPVELKVSKNAFYYKNKLTQVAESVGERVTGGPAVTGALVGLTTRESAAAVA